MSKPVPFAHLHQHTAYSLLDGAARIKDLVGWVKEVSPDNPTIAMTDHGNMHGAVEFYNIATGMGVKPIIGFEAYVAAGSRFEKKRASSKLDGGYFHLTLLAENFKGYQNLCKLNSRGWLEGFYGKPRVDHELLKDHSEGVIALSGCLGAQIPRNLLDADFAAGEAMLDKHLDIFGENFFIELQNHAPANPDLSDPKLADLVEQQSRLNPMLKELANKYGIAMVATNDGHYVKKDDAKAHEALLAIQTKTTLSDPNRFRFPCDEFYVKTPEEMAVALPESEYPNALKNTYEIADRCNVDLPVGHNRVYQMPELPIPGGRTLGEQLRIQTYQGLVTRYDIIDEALFREYFSHTGKTAPSDFEELLLQLAKAGEGCAKEKTEEQNFGTYEYPHLAKFEQSDANEEAITIIARAEFELGVIIAMGFPDYFLIVADFIIWAKEQAIAVGPGRGSGAGSIVAYALLITNIDPLEFDLLFERFLNPDRISMPDFDIDFSDVRRNEVIDYVRKKYGDEKVAHIATFGTMASKAAIKDAARVLEAPYADADAFAKLIPVVFGRSTPIQQAMDEVGELKAMYQQQATEFVDVAMSLEGLTRHASIHAAGVIIAREDITELAPVFRSKDGPIICQYDMGCVEDLGFIKMDFLGLRTLSFIEAAIKIIEETHGVKLDPDNFPKEDTKTFELLSRGEAAGVFQFEGAGMIDTLKRLKPRRVQDLIAVSALYRPGPMENIPTYIRRHHGREKVEYKEFPKAEQILTPILEETYGIPVYQEQIMQIAQGVAGYTLGEADILRRAMGKKKVEEMAKQRLIFEKGAAEKNIPSKEANGIFDLLEKFANYGFNKSHSAAYGALSYQTAYIKAHYPVEFIAALLTVERANSDKVAEYVNDATQLGIPVLPPDINESRDTFTPLTDLVRFGLFGIKNVGDMAVENILQERQAGGKFKDLHDFCERISGSAVNKRAVENLIKSGAFDALGKRHVLLENMETAIKWGNAQKEQKEVGQMGLFGADETRPVFKVPEKEPHQLDLLRMEKESLGLYISDHPMNSYAGLAEAASCRVADLDDWYEEHQFDYLGVGRVKVALSGLLQNIVKKPTKKGDMMAFFEINDGSKGVEVIAFSRIYEEIALSLEEDAPAVVVLELSEEDESLRLVVDKVIRWDKERTLPEIAMIEFDITQVSDYQLLELRSLVDEFSGITPLQIRVQSPDGLHLIETEGIRVNKERLEEIEATCPWLKSAVTLDKSKLLVPSEKPKFYQRNAPEQQHGSIDTPF